MSDGIRIREATLDDLEVILRHRRQMFYDMGLTDPADLDAMQSACEPFFRQAIGNGSYRGWLALVEPVTEAIGRIVGGGGVWLAPWPPHPRGPMPFRPYILNMFTEPEYRRQGVGRRLLEVILDWCRAQGFHWVSLHASEQGRPLYASLGFQASSEMRLHLK